MPDDADTVEKHGSRESLLENCVEKYVLMVIEPTFIEATAWIYPIRAFLTISNSPLDSVGLCSL
jgi:hypothetical protein